MLARVFGRKAGLVGIIGVLVATGASAQDLVYISNVTGTEANGQPVLSIEGQTTRTLDQLGEALRAHGLDYADVVVANVFLRDTRHFQAMNAIYRTYFESDPPTRATVEADLPDPDALIQVSIVAARGEKEVIRPRGLQSPALPYSWGIKTGNTLFIAGATSRNPDTYQPQTGPIGEQTSRVFGNIGLVLEEAGMDYSDLVGCKVFLDDPRQFGAMNTAYRGFVSADDPPVRATMRAGLMNPLFAVEIQCVAEQSGNRSVVVGEGMRRSRAPFSPAIAIGDRVYTAGMVGGGTSDVAEQTRRILNNLQRTLAAAGMDFSNVVDTWIYVADIRQWRAIKEVLDEVLPPGAANGTVIGMPLMGATLFVEIQMTAAR